MSDQSQYEVVLFPSLHHVRFGLVNISYRNLHVHREMELQLILDGEALVKSKTHTYFLKRGMFLLTNSNEPHEITAQNNTSVRILYLQISNNFCREYLQLLHSISFQVGSISEILSPEDNRTMIELILKAYEHYQENTPENRLRCMTDVFHLLELLIDLVPYKQIDESERVTAKKRQRLERITDHIDRHYYEKLSLAELAAQEGVTVSYLSRFIHDQIGMTFQDYVSNVRLEKAMMLMGDNMKLTDISISCGFSDVKYFLNTFKKQFGCTPEEYLKRGFIPGNRQELQEYADSDTAHSWIEQFIKEEKINLPFGGQK